MEEYIEVLDKEIVNEDLNNLWLQVGFVEGIIADGKSFSSLEKAYQHIFRRNKEYAIILINAIPVRWSYIEDIPLMVENLVLLLGVISDKEKDGNFNLKFETPNFSTQWKVACHKEFVEIDMKWSSVLGNYEEALNKAQKLGFAESDPTLDVKGYDAKYKLAITIAHSFGCFVKPEHILNLGIDKISAHDIRYAKQQGCAIKLIAKAEKIGNKVFGIVAPTLVPVENPLASVKNEFNAINLIGASTGLQMLTGKGAGSLPTGLVVLSDVASLASGFKYSYPKITNDNPVVFETDALINVHVSFSEAGAIRLTDFEEFTGGYQGEDGHFMTGWIRIKKLAEWVDRNDLSIIVLGDTPFKVYESKKEQELSLA